MYACKSSSAAVRTMSVAQATVIQKVSHLPFKPKYGCFPLDLLFEMAILLGLSSLPPLAYLCI